MSSKRILSPWCRPSTLRNTSVSGWWCTLGLLMLSAPGMLTVCGRLQMSITSLRQDRGLWSTCPARSRRRWAGRLDRLEQVWGSCPAHCCPGQDRGNGLCELGRPDEQFLFGCSGVEFGDEVLRIEFHADRVRPEFGA